MSSGICVCQNCHFLKLAMCAERFEVFAHLPSSLTDVFEVLDDELHLGVLLGNDDHLRFYTPSNIHNGGVLTELLPRVVCAMKPL